MRHRYFTLAVLLTLAIGASSKDNTKPGEASAPDSIIRVYTDSLAALVNRQQTASPAQSTPNPYLFRILGPGTLFTSAIAQQMGQPAPLLGGSTLPSLGTITDRQLLLNEASNTMLSRAYAYNPQLFIATQAELNEAGSVRSDLEQTIVAEQKLAEKVVEEVPDVVVEAVEPEVKRPNFWTFKGNGGLQFTQTYLSKNWYKGGLNSYSLLSFLNVEANFNNQRKVSLNNKLEARLGFQATETNIPKFRPIDNLLRFTSNFGVKAVGHWNYAAQLQLQSQPYPGYRGSTKEVISNFLAPLYVRSSIGMDFNIDKKRFKGTLKLAPLSYVITYVRIDSIARKNFGFDEGVHAKHDFGPNIQFNFTYQMAKNIKWESRFYWFTTFKSTLIENDHKFTFSINKYLSATLFLYPRFEDTKYYGLSYEKENGQIKTDADGKKILSAESARQTHWMFQEFLSLGFNYDF